MMRRVFFLLAAILAFILGWWAGHRAQPPGDVRVRIDTLFYARPSPAATCSRPVTIQVPRTFFVRAPPDAYAGSEIVEADGNLSEIPTAWADSVAVGLEVVTHLYEDSLYRAQVSGPAIGDLGPALDWLEVRGRSVFKTETRPYRWEIGPAAGTWYSTAGSGVWIGADVRRTLGRLSVEAAGGYDPRNRGPFIQLRAGVALWRR